MSEEEQSKGWTSTPDDPVSFPERLAVIRELMSTFEVVTRGGQDHVMRKVLGILRKEILSVGLRLTDGQLGVVMALLNDLEHEAGRVVPRPTAFNDNASSVVDVLVRARRDRAGEPRLIGFPIPSFTSETESLER